jgi:DNA polymerase-3 subunit delta
LVQELQKLLAKEKWAKEFTSLVGAQLSSWIKTETEQRGGTINPAAVAYLAQNVGKDIWYADSLVDQLVAYAEGKEISLADVQLFLEEKVDDNVFNMVDAIVAGNRKLAFKLVEEQRRLGEEDGLIFGMAMRQFRILISMRDLFNCQENITSDTMAKMLDLHPFVVKKSLPFIKKYSLDKLKDIYNQLLEIDIKTKTGLADQSLLIDLFVGKLS